MRAAPSAHHHIGTVSLRFHLTELRNNRYRIALSAPELDDRVVEASAPFSLAEWAGFRAIPGHSGQPPVPEQEPEAVRRLGERLFEFLIGDHPDFLSIYQAARSADESLSLRLDVEDTGELAALPWEYLRDPSDDFLALLPDVGLARTFAGLTPLPPVPVIRPLRVLVVIAAPPNYPPFDSDAEWSRLVEATAPLQTAGLLHLDRLSPPTWTALKRRLRAEDDHIIHFIAYTHLDEAANQRYLVLEDEQYASASRPVPGTDFAAEIGSTNTIRLAILQTQPDESGRDSAIPFAAEWVRRGLAGALAFHRPLGSVSASIFNSTFYRTLSDHQPIDTGLMFARRELFARSPGLDWASPLLVLRSANGRLFRPARSAF